MNPEEEFTVGTWHRAADELDFRFVAPFFIEEAGRTLTYLGWLPQFGSDRGMLIITNGTTEEQEVLARVAAERGFGFSCMAATREAYDRALTIEVLKDWGWASSEPAPRWYESSPRSTRGV